MRRDGFTFVELVVVALIVVALLAILIPILREREQQRLQAMADAEPWEVFEFRAEPVKEIFAEGERVVVQCEIVNRTGYPLSLPKDLDVLVLTFGDTNYFVGQGRFSDAITRTTIAPGESVSFDAPFYLEYTGAAEVRIVFHSIQDYAEAILKIRPAVNRTKILDLLPLAFSDKKRFQSHAFKLVVKESDASELPTFEEIIAETKQ